jgi:hypothetical protein
MKDQQKSTTDSLRELRLSIQQSPLDRFTNREPKTRTILLNKNIISKAKLLTVTINWKFSVEKKMR